MRRITSSRVSALVFGGGLAAALAFGATSAVAAPGKDVADRYFCGYYYSEEGCDQCCRMDLPHSWEGIECYCEW